MSKKEELSDLIGGYLDKNQEMFSASKSKDITFKLDKICDLFVEMFCDLQNYLKIDDSLNGFESNLKLTGIRISNIMNCIHIQGNWCQILDNQDFDLNFVVSFSEMDKILISIRSDVRSKFCLFYFNKDNINTKSRLVYGGYFVFPQVASV